MEYEAVQEAYKQVHNKPGLVTKSDPSVMEEVADGSDEGQGRDGGESQATSVWDGGEVC